MTRDREAGGAHPRVVLATLRRAERRLDEAGVGESVADARILLAHVLARPATWVMAHGDDGLTVHAEAAHAALIERRAARVPLQHLLGHQDFWSSRFAVNADVLIPRPETELLVELALEAFRGVSGARLADVGTGSGCIALSLAAELPEALVIASDVSARALACARDNASRLGLAERVMFLEGDLCAPLAPHGPLDAVLANLPYISREEWQGLEPEVRDHDPELALVGGEHGTEIISWLVVEAPSVLKPGGLLVLEVGHGQASEVATELRRNGYVDVEIHRDLAGIPRVVVGRRGSPAT